MKRNISFGLSLSLILWLVVPLARAGTNRPGLPTAQHLNLSEIRWVDSLVVAEGFSPNGDGINDTFAVRYSGPEVIVLEIVNRWGQRVYFSGDYRSDWDGKANQGGFGGGQTHDALPDGTFYFVVRAVRRCGYADKE